MDSHALETTPELSAEDPIGAPVYTAGAFFCLPGGCMIFDCKIRRGPLKNIRLLQCNISEEKDEFSACQTVLPVRG